MGGRSGRRREVVTVQVRVDQPKDEPFGLQFNNNGAPAGDIKLTFFVVDGIFKIQNVVDAQRQSFGTFFNVDRADRPYWNTLQLQFANGAYNLTLGGGKR
jgi:hypothetical protein